jgi:hypothetical protein
MWLNGFRVSFYEVSRFKKNGIEVEKQTCWLANQMSCANFWILGPRIANFEHFSRQKGNDDISDFGPLFVSELPFAQYCVFVHNSIDVYFSQQSLALSFVDDASNGGRCNNTAVVIRRYL